MKKILTLLLCVAITFSLSAIFVSCADKNPQASETSVDKQTSVNAQSTTSPVVTTKPADTTKAPVATTEPPITAETTTPEPKELSIATAEELRAISTDNKDYYSYTINITADIDLSGENWIPMDGSRFFNVIFNGNNHEISGMTIVGNEKQHYLGFISSTKGGMITFNDLNFIDVSITSYGKECAVLVGQNTYSQLFFNNVSIKNVNLNGYTDYDKDSGLIAFRVAGFVGGNWSIGMITINNCSVDSFTASGFHNLAAFVGYDSVGGESVTITNSTVKDMILTFSYCLSPNYTIDQKLKYVQVFYNTKDWSDTLDPCLKAGNTYTNVVFIDYTTSNTIDPVDFRTIIDAN